MTAGVDVLVVGLGPAGAATARLRFPSRHKTAVRRALRAATPGLWATVFLATVVVACRSPALDSQKPSLVPEWRIADRPSITILGGGTSSSGLGRVAGVRRLASGSFFVRMRRRGRPCCLIPVGRSFCEWPDPVGGLGS